MHMFRYQLSSYRATVNGILKTVLASLISYNPDSFGKYVRLKDLFMHVFTMIRVFIK